mmetsp:Transcript_10653/g.26228  ORF Transcript_10653/g.26228 Transcript_10653/m.26228 type:complete len:192 (+) Transcript_10653:364-939(+)
MELDEAERSLLSSSAGEGAMVNGNLVMMRFAMVVFSSLRRFVAAISSFRLPDDVLVSGRGRQRCKMEYEIVVVIVVSSSSSSLHAGAELRVARGGAVRRKEIVFVLIRRIEYIGRRDPVVRSGRRYRQLRVYLNHLLERSTSVHDAAGSQPPSTWHRPALCLAVLLCLRCCDGEQGASAAESLPYWHGHRQ